MLNQDLVDFVKSLMDGGIIRFDELQKQGLDVLKGQADGQPVNQVAGSMSANAPISSTPTSFSSVPNPLGVQTIQDRVQNGPIQAEIMGRINVAYKDLFGSDTIDVLKKKKQTERK